jgi:ADP-heptose:LPS heptosyltransferase
MGTMPSHNFLFQLSIDSILEKFKIILIVADLGSPWTIFMALLAASRNSVKCLAKPNHPQGVHLFQGKAHPITLRIAIYRSSSIGDVVLATACLDFIRQLQFKVEVTWIGSEPSLDLIRQSFPEINCLDIKSNASKDQLKHAVKELSSIHFLVDLQTNLRSRWLAIQLRKHFGIPAYTAPKMQVYRSKLLLRARIRGRRFEIPDGQLIPRMKQFTNMVAALESGLRAQLPTEYLDRPSTNPARPSLIVKNPQITPWQQELRFSRWIAIAPGAAHKTKRAPKELFSSILEKPSHHSSTDRVGLIILGSSEDREDANELLKSAFWPGPTMNLAGRLSLWESTIALLESELLISNDSALAHIAEAVNTPVGVLFGPTVEAFGFGPQLTESQSFSSPVGCRPCSKHGKSVCRFGDQKCFYDIDLESIVAFATERLSIPKNRLSINNEKVVSSQSPVEQSTLSPERK